MIRYTLKCESDHNFDSWFQSADAFTALQTGGHIVCPTCGSSQIQKSLMAPGVQTARAKAGKAQPPVASISVTPQEKALAELREHVEKNSDYVGLKFADEARKMHEGELPSRAIYGEAKPEEAKKLVEDGVPVAPLPFVPRSRTN